jgi:hypothetical protein
VAGADLGPAGGRLVAPQIGSKVVDGGAVGGELDVEPGIELVVAGQEPTIQVSARPPAFHVGYLQALLASALRRHITGERHVVGGLDLVPPGLEPIQRTYFEILDEDDGRVRVDAHISWVLLGQTHRGFLAVEQNAQKSDQNN